MSAADAIRAGIEGVPPLPGRLEAWQRRVCADPARLESLLDEHGSPLNLLELSALERNADELRRAAASHGIELGIFMARKANKSLALVDAAVRHGLGIDLASETELSQCLERGVIGEEMVMTAAVKPESLLELCVHSGTVVSIDNADELDRIESVADRLRRPAPIAFRLAPAGFDTRFGLTADRLLELATRRCGQEGRSLTELVGLHFHLDGYSASDRVRAASEALTLIDALRDQGLDPSFLDIGGGIPISYLESRADWDRFWAALETALGGEGEPITYRNHGLGLTSHEGKTVGRANVYPYFQRPVRAAWLEQVLAAPIGVDAGGGREGLRGAPTPTGATLASAIRDRGIELRCEPGRSLLDGCGMTVARVEHRKRRPDGWLLVGLAMNRTQMRSTSEDFMVDPLLLPGSRRGSRGSGQVEAEQGFLVGAYCIERELISWRRMSFPARGRGWRSDRLPEHGGLSHAHPRERLPPDPPRPQPGAQRRSGQPRSDRLMAAGRRGRCGTLIADGRDGDRERRAAGPSPSPRSACGSTSSPTPLCPWAWSAEPSRRRLRVAV